MAWCIAALTQLDLAVMAGQRQPPRSAPSESAFVNAFDRRNKISSERPPNQAFKLPVLTGEYVQ